jgi:hypothetical protein
MNFNFKWEHKYTYTDLQITIRSDGVLYYQFPDNDIFSKAIVSTTSNDPGIRTLEILTNHIAKLQENKAAIAAALDWLKNSRIAQNQDI